MPSHRPTITPEDLFAIRATFAAAIRDPKATASRFYAVLFGLDPSLRSLFHGDLHHQGEKLINMLTLLVSNLGNLDQLLPTVRQLGRRHASYGVKAAHFTTVGNALIETLKAQAGETWTIEAQNGWQKAYDLLARNMQLAVGTPTSETAGSLQR